MTKNKGNKRLAKTGAPSVSADTAARRMRRLADAIAALLNNPITVRMHELWRELTDEDRRRAALDPPDHVRRRSLAALEASEKALAAARARRKELDAVFAEARLDLQEDEAVFLERAIAALPSAGVDEHDHSCDQDGLADEHMEKLSNLGIGLRHRADVAERGFRRSEAQSPVEQPTPPTDDVCTIAEHESGIGVVVCVGSFQYHIRRPRCIEFIQRAKSGKPVKCPEVRTWFQHDRRPVRKMWKDSGEARATHDVLRDHEAFAHEHIASIGKGRYCIVRSRSTHAQ